MRIAIVGAGRRGTHHAQVVARSGLATVHVVVDVDPMRAELLASTMSARASVRLEDAFDADAAIVASPGPSHLPLALMLLDAGVPLFVENPLSDRFEEAVTIVRASGAAGVAMTAGFVERFNPVVQMALRLLEDAGPAIHVAGLRHAPPEPVTGADVVFDLLVHDIDLALRMLDGEWTGDAVGGVWPGPDPSRAEIADCALATDAGAAATLTACRSGQRTLQWIEVATEGQQMELDLSRRTMTVFDHPSGEPRGSRAPMIIDIPSATGGGDASAHQLARFLSLVRGELDPEAERRGLLAPYRAAALVRSRAPGGDRMRVPESAVVA